MVKRDADGKLEIQKATDHSTRKGLKWGIVGGVALGLIFPPSIIGSAAALGAGRRRDGQGPPAAPPQRARRPAGGRDRPRSLGDRGAGLRPRRGGDPQGLGAADAIVESAVDDVVAKDIKAAAEEAESESESDEA